MENEELIEGETQYFGQLWGSILYDEERGKGCSYCFSKNYPFTAILISKRFGY